MKLYGIVILAIFIAATIAEPLQKTFFKDIKNSTSRIVGGSPAQRNQFPYQISLQLNNQHFCGGSILTQEWIVTAGHCIFGSPNTMSVVAGMLNQRENHPDIQTSRVLQIIRHPRFPGGVAPNDIALIKLSTRLRWTNAVQPIALPRENEEFSGLAWVTGWGYLTSSNQVTPTTLQQIQMQIWTFNQCANTLTSLMGHYRPLDNTMLCVGGAHTGRETVCQGDSGGPLMQNGKLLGVTSWTLTPCGMYRSPSVYTKVSKFIGFIKQYVPGV